MKKTSITLAACLTTDMQVTMLRFYMVTGTWQVRRHIPGNKVATNITIIYTKELGTYRTISQNLLLVFFSKQSPINAQMQAMQVIQAMWAVPLVCYAAILLFYSNQLKLSWVCKLEWSLTKKGKNGGKIMLFKVATNVVASRPPECQPNGTPTTRAKNGL